MDQIKIGKFIASMRKEQSMTQRQLADVLNISDKTVSKWECGNGMPEVALMLPLCEVLRINVNELLSGERLDGADYQRKAEENMMELVREREESKKKIILAVVVCVLTILSGVTIILVSGLLEMMGFESVEDEKQVLDISAGTFECRKCGTRFVPSSAAYIAGVHTITTRKLKCPHCGQVSYCKKRLTH